MIHKKHSGVFTLAALLLGMAAATAAPVTWTSKLYTVNGGWGQYLNTGIFDNTGTLIRAENVGGAATTFDGINFSAGTTVFSGTYGGFHDGVAPLISKTGTYGGTGPNTVTLSGLTPGNSYRVQALVYDGRGDTGIPGRRVSFDGIDQGQYANGVSGVTWGPGLLVTGTFVADASSQAFTVEAFLGASSKGGQLNALLVHEFVAGTPVLSNPSVTSITATDAMADADLAVVNAGVTLYWDTVDQGTGIWAHSSSLGNQTIGLVSGSMTGLTADTLYFYRFSAVNTGPDPDTVGWSPAATSFVTALTGLSPADPQASTFSKTEIDVSWTDGFNTETGFIIERSPNGTDSWTQAGTAAADAQVFYDSGLFPGTTYYYRVLAQNGAGVSDPSTVVSATTLPPTPGITVQAWYQMGDNGQGTNNRPVDSSPNTRHFTGNASSATMTPNGGGYSNDAYYSFNGVDQGYYGTGYDAPENNVGIEVWVRTSDLAQTNHHVFGTGSNANGLNIGYDASGSAGWFGAIANVAFVGTVGTANYTGGDWVHLALVRDFGVTTFYVNGVASGTSTANPLNATQPHMGVNAGGAAGGFFGGDIAEARIFTFDPGQFNVSHLLYPGTVPSDPYATWAGSFPGLTNPGADLDFDNGGLSTGIEWVTGGDPSVGNDDAGVIPTFNNTDPANFLFTFRRRDAAAGDAGTTIVVEYGNNLGAWTPAQNGVDGVTIDDSTDLGGEFHQVTVSIPRSLAAGGKLFAHLKVSRP